MKRRKPQIIDREATEAAHFLDKRSYIKRMKDGELHTFLFGADMTLLRVKVFNRAGGSASMCTCKGHTVSVQRDTAFCEMKVHGVLGARCNRNISWETFELHHEPPLSQEGYDSEESTVASCHRCQTIRHARTTRWKKSEPQARRAEA